METVCDLEIFLYDLILGKDELEENLWVKQDEHTARKQRFTVSGAMIRQLSILRKRRSTDDKDLTEANTPKKNSKRSSTPKLEDVSTCTVWREWNGIRRAKIKRWC